MNTIKTALLCIYRRFVAVDVDSALRIFLKLLDRLQIIEGRLLDRADDLKSQALTLQFEADAAVREAARAATIRRNITTITETRH